MSDVKPASEHYPLYARTKRIQAESKQGENDGLDSDDKRRFTLAFAALEKTGILDGSEMKFIRKKVLG